MQQTGIVKHDIEIGLTSPSMEKIKSSLKLLKDRLKEIEGVEDIGDNADEGEKELKLRVNEYGQSLGLNEGYITSILRGAFLKGEYAKAFNREGLIRVRIEDRYKDNLNELRDFKITTPDGKVVRLKDVCDFYYKKSFVKIFKENGERVVEVFARVDNKRVIASVVMEKLAPTLREIEKSGVKVLIKGEAKENQKTIRDMLKAGIIAIFLIFITLVWMFNSVIQPLIVLSIIPLSLLGVFVGTKLMGLNLTLPGIMGIVGLAGVVVNDGLIMLSTIKKAKDRKELIELATQRLRPIILTSITTVLGLSSLIFFASGQALILQPMAVSLGFGAWQPF